MTKKILGSILLTCSLSAAVFAQDQKPCATDDVYLQLKKDHPEIVQFEAQVEQALHQVNLKNFARTTTDTTYYDVPVVIHVIHDYGAEYISDNVIFDNFAIWRTVFEGRNADTADVIRRFKPIVGNPHIRLHLATKDPNGNPTKGITRRQSYWTAKASDQAKIDGWPNNKYINIWVINTFGGQSVGAAAYAYYPSSGAAIPYYDGVIGLYVNWTQSTYEKAIPHEIGHVLNLQHVWGNTNAPAVACGDDGVADTPPTKGHNPTGCTAASLYDTDCSAPDTNNSQNIMDYTYCMRMFTQGQVDRMQTALTSSVAGRNNLYSAANLAATGALDPSPDLAPTADFSVEKGQSTSGINLTSERAYFLCMNNLVNFVFSNRSWNDTITGLSWTFSNGATTPTATATSQYSVIRNQFSQPGWVTVTLAATGNNSGTGTVTRKAVYVADSTVRHPAGYVQNFSSDDEMAQWPIFNYYNNNFQWERYTGAGYDDNSCIRYRSFDYRTSPENRSGAPAGDYDDIFTPGFDLSEFAGSNALNFNFFTAGAFAGSNSINDSLQILASVDCGRTWSVVSSLKGTNLINNGTSSSEFVPSNASQWKAQTINIPAAARASKVFFKLRYWPGANGNDLYLDKFSITPYTTEVNEVANSKDQISMYPNPTKGNVSLVFKTGADGKVAYTVRDMAGKVIYTASENLAPNAMAQRELASSLFRASGMYLVTITIAERTTTQKLVVE